MRRGRGKYAREKKKEKKEVTNKRKEA